MHRVACLVDYDNVRPLQERTLGDVTLNLEILVDGLVGICRSFVYPIDELLLRLYGGWIDEDGRLTRNAEWILSTLGRHRGRRDGIRVSPRIITSLAHLPGEILVGTVRSRTSPPRQKMVDGIITVDAMYFAEQADWILLVVSDDDDLVPAALVASITTSRSNSFVYWARKRLVGGGLNDPLLIRSEVVLGNLELGLAGNA